MEKKTGIIQLRLAEKCMVCEERQLQGIHVIDSFLCESCERKIIESDTDDRDYIYYLKQLRKIQSHSGMK